MNFYDLHQRLTAELRERVRSGRSTERSLARQMGISQPHMHNVLKGEKSFSPEMADEILRRLGIDLLDLIGFDDWSVRPPRR